MSRITRFALSAALAVATLPAFADTYNVDKSHSEATFTIRHLMSRVLGRFEDFSGAVNIDKANSSASTVEFTIKTASVDTANADRDKHLQGEDFFFTQKYPEITFKSTSVQPAKTKDLYTVTGDLTMRGVTKRVTLAVTFLGYANDPWGNERAGFELDTTLNRKDYGINWNKAVDNGMLLSDDVDIAIALETVKKK